MIEQEYRMTCAGPDRRRSNNNKCPVDCFKVRFMMVAILLLGANPNRKAKSIY